jgi:hypothetical protein
MQSMNSNKECCITLLLFDTLERIHKRCTVRWTSNVLPCVVVLPSHQQHPEDGDAVTLCHAEKPSHRDATVCSKTFHWIPSPRKLKDLHVP